MRFKVFALNFDIVVMKLSRKFLGN